MDKRLLKRHQRQVLRAKARVRLSEPDVRTPDQIKAAREASRSADDRRKGPNMRHSAPAFQNSPARPTGSAAKTAVSE